ncbi:MAG: hypothetical protein LBU37_01470 [Tannerellaceae bacterium]|jgi:hypothetical protein|nr:hypothetical protein [Tannerellaceae bacterium]
MKTRSNRLPTEGKDMIHFNQEPGLSNDLNLHSQSMSNTNSGIVINKDANESKISKNDVADCNMNHSNVQLCLPTGNC